MPFNARNSYYLRISQTSVIPLYVYLDDRHLDWMSDRILQHVIADLQPRILPKLRAEADAHLGPGGPVNAKRGTVDVHQGDSYQFCYFFRKSEPHSVLVKSRNFTVGPAPQVGRSQEDEPVSRVSSGKRRGTLRSIGMETGRKKRKTTGKGEGRHAKGDDQDEIMAISSGESDHGVVEVASSDQYTNTTRRSLRTNKKMIAGGYRHAQESDEDSGIDEVDDTWRNDVSVNVKDEPMDVELLDSTADPAPEDRSQPFHRPEPGAVVAESEGVESKPKLILKLGYSNFVICGRCLVVVVEPWPALSSDTARSIADLPSPSLTAPRKESSGLASSKKNGTERARTPLFLPELDIAPFDHDHGDGMLVFSQALQSRGDFQAGVAGDDDDEMDGVAFLGDADEARDL